MMATEYGFIYILANESMPGIYKIGFTLGHPQARMDQLSAATACPTPFVLVASFGCRNPRKVEQEMHADLSGNRVNRSREFFRCSMATLLEMVDEHSDQYGDMTYTMPLFEGSNMERLRHAEQWKIDYFLSQDVDPIEWPEKWVGGFH